MKTCFIGDSNAIIPDCFGFPMHTSGIPGLPVWDKELISILDSVAHFDIIFYSCATELHGIRRFKDIEALAKLPVEQRFIDFTGADRYCYKEKYYNTIPYSQRIFLLNKYIEQLKFIVSTWKQIVLVPIAAKFQLSPLPPQIKFPLTYKIILSEFRAIALDTLDENDPTNFRDEFWHLSEVGFRKLMGLLSDGVNPESH